MPRSRCQLRVRYPQPLLLLPLLARPHRHAPILQTKPVDTSTLSAHESELAPRAARGNFWNRGRCIGDFRSSLGCGFYGVVFTLKLSDAVEPALVTKSCVPNIIRDLV